ncbi:hypothetical protein [Rummeliibacillus stabekisii]|uniref:hypothetical protein n=1 Tax=Rummeliibacillus stabekisii TaxID=241244 RepID=UPI00116DA532|nr:hypothetical protein [Rummeliibacillus stabekisii]MBB5170366.1 hypothetical protein [Rummeliibacillus stabekisii]GEL04625.1 hypothetical protein RST01_12520 [Rummeliibacillus stabekisii]
MGKLKIGFSVIVIILLVWTGIHYMNTFKTKSLANDILTDVNFDKVDVSLINISDKEAKIIDFDQADSTKFIQVLREVEVKRIRTSKWLGDDYIVLIGGSGGSFQLYLSKQGTFVIDAESDEPYTFLDKEAFNDLLVLIKKQLP